jgi:hypothetical protein
MLAIVVWCSLTTGNLVANKPSDITVAQEIYQYELNHQLSSDAKPDIKLLGVVDENNPWWGFAMQASQPGGVVPCPVGDGRPLVPKQQ